MQYQGVYVLVSLGILGIALRAASSAFRPVASVRFASSSTGCFPIFSLSFPRSSRDRCKRLSRLSLQTTCISLRTPYDALSVLVVCDDGHVDVPRGSSSWSSPVSQRVVDLPNKGHRFESSENGIAIAVASRHRIVGSPPEVCEAVFEDRISRDERVLGRRSLLFRGNGAAVQPASAIALCIEPGPVFPPFSLMTRSTLPSILDITVASMTVLFSRIPSAPPLQQYFSDDRIDDLLTCFHRSLFPLPPTLQQQCVEDGESFYWSQQTSLLRKSLFVFLKGVSELAPQRILRYLTTFYDQAILTNSASVQELFGFLCMIEGSHPHLSKELSIAQMWSSLLQPCCSFGLEDPSFIVVSMEAIRCLRVWYQDISESILTEVNKTLLTCLQTHFPVVRENCAIMSSRSS